MTIVRVVDFETTGFEPPIAQVCEVGIYDVDVKSFEVLDGKSWLCGVDNIPPEVRAIHHISLNDCDGFPPFDNDTLDSDSVYCFAAHNAEFELKFLSTSKPMICTYKAALRMWPDAPTHSNMGLRYWLEDQGKLSLEADRAMPAHRAGPDAYVTAHILLALINDGATGKDMIAWTKEPKLLPTCPIGKFRGMKWADVETGFLSWMINNATMEEDLKWNARKEIERRNK